MPAPDISDCLIQNGGDSHGKAKLKIHIESTVKLNQKGKWCYGSEITVQKQF
jgi:hypothetical protein